LCAARSPNGVDGWVIDDRPTLAPDPEHYPEELWGIEDPRITFVDELGKYVVAYTAFSKGGPGVALALTSDFRSFERYGLVMQPDDKDAALLPRRVDGSFALLHRPATDSGAHIWISYSPDLRHWGDHALLLEARDGAWWDAGKIGLGPPPLETPEGWLIGYHGVHTTASGPIYRVGLALLDLDDPRKVRNRSAAWVMGPQEPYEITGDVNKVVFPNGWVHDPVTDVLSLYYGAGDSVIAVATAKLRDVVANVLASPATVSPPPAYVRT
jgi:predicted GH43/DUF377 family glycosyl hydrolase